MQRSLAIRTIDKRHHAQGNQRAQGKKRGPFSRWTGAEDGKEEPRSSGAESFGFKSLGLRRHYRRNPDGTWTKLLDIPLAEENAIKTRKGWPNGPILPPAKAGNTTGKRSGGKRGAKNAAALDNKEAEEHFSGEKEGGVDSDEIDDDYIDGLPCIRDERESGFGIGSNVWGGGKWLGKQERIAQD